MDASQRGKTPNKQGNATMIKTPLKYSLYNLCMDTIEHREKNAKINLTSASFKQRYYLGKKYPEKYFTHREAMCMLYMLQGLNYKQIANLLSLSPRTVGFYCSNMRIKLRCKSKKELVHAMRQLDFMNLIANVNPYNENSCLLTILS